MSKLSTEHLTDIYLILAVEGIGPAKFKNLLIKFKSTESILSANFDLLADTEGIGINIAKKIQSIKHKRSSVREFVIKELEKLDKLGATIITILDQEYPFLLKKIFDPPVILYVKGSLADEDNYPIAIVGTRKPTSYGKMHAEKIAGDLALQHITIVSGMARGIDTIAQTTALKKGGRTVAVIGSGLDVIYPPENKKLFHEITESGAVISEFYLGTKPDAVNFPRRNRIISGISLGTVVIETGIKGGAMQTADFSLEQNREVFAVPGNLGVKQSEGTNLKILRSEAKLIRSAEDVLDELQLKLKPVIGKNIPKPEVELNFFEEKILETLKDEPIQIDQIAAIAELSTSDCLVHLLTLEFKGLIKQMPGKVFVLSI